LPGPLGLQEALHGLPCMGLPQGPLYCLLSTIYYLLSTIYYYYYYLRFTIYYFVRSHFGSLASS